MIKKDTSICEICGEKFDNGRIKSNHLEFCKAVAEHNK